MQRKQYAWAVAIVISGAISLSAAAQTSHQGLSQPDQSPSSQASPQQKGTPEGNKPDSRTHITAAQAKELFASVSQILQFASNDTALPIHHEVKSKLITRSEVEKYLVKRMNDDKDAKRMERSEIVLKKFGLLDSDFELRPFLVKLLDEQIAAFYDSKTKTVNLLDWVDPGTQKPVLAHELTHALQDQAVGLEKWQNKTSDDIARTYQQDLRHVATDEDDTAREAVLEGQAMAVFVDYSLAPLGKNLRNAPGFADKLADASADLSGSPVMARAPLVLQESLLFPYTDGLKFEGALLTDTKSREAAFADVLKRPPSSSYEIMNPHAYERQAVVPVLQMPDIHPIIQAHYAPYDIGVMGELDVKILTELFGGRKMEALLTPQWDGGIYYAAQKKDAPNKNSTSSVALLYLSQWKSSRAASLFMKMFAGELPKQYSQVTRDAAAESSQDEQIYQTNEGPMLLVKSGKDVFVSESFDLGTARKLQLLMLGAQQQNSNQRVAAAGPPPGAELTGGMVRFMERCGMMKAALPR